jgi:two-component system response regulator NreC
MSKISPLGLDGEAAWYEIGMKDSAAGSSKILTISVKGVLWCVVTDEAVVSRESPAVTGFDDGPIRIVLADDHGVVRSGLRMLLESTPGLEVVAEAADVDAAMSCVRGHRPEVLVLDLSMPGGSTFDLIPSVRTEFPQTQVVILTMQKEPAFASKALSLGALGYVLKEAAKEELIEAVRRASVGQSYLNPRLGAQIASEPVPGHFDDLSEREVGVLRLIVLGYTNSEIAERLYLSVRTVETHRAHIQQKLKISTRAGLVGYALEHKLISVGSESL